MEAGYQRTHNGLAAIWRSVCIRRKSDLCLSVVCVLTLLYKHVGLHMYILLAVLRGSLLTMTDVNVIALCQ